MYVIQLQQHNSRAAYLLLSVPSIKAIEKDIRTNVQVITSSSLFSFVISWIYPTVAAMARGRHLTT